MIVNHSRRYVFLEIPKNASTSLKQFFREDGGIVDRNREVVEVLEYEPATSQVAYARSLLREHGFSWDSCFVIIRDPFSRALSQYEYARRQRQLEPSVKTFRDYVFQGGFSKQCDFVRDPDTGDALVTRANMLRFDRLAADFQDRFLQRYYPGSSSASLPHVNSSRYEREAAEYFDDETVAGIVNMYADEFEFFGFPTEPRFSRVGL